MSRQTTLSGLQRGILLFWSIWFLIICLTNTFDVLVTFHLLRFDWPAVSNNYLLIEKATSIYHFQNWVNDLFFFTIIAWEAICSVLFFRAFLFFRSWQSGNHAILLEPFGAALALFCGFILACEVFILYETEGVHFRIFMALLLSFMFVRIPATSVSLQ